MLMQYSCVDLQRTKDIVEGRSLLIPFPSFIFTFFARGHEQLQDLKSLNNKSNQEKEQIGEGGWREPLPVNHSYGKEIKSDKVSSSVSLGLLCENTGRELQMRPRMCS